MNRTRVQCTAVTALLVLLVACGSEAETRVKLSSLSAAEHQEVMNLLKQVYEAGVGGRIVAWYETTARGYYDVRTREMISFDEPVQTLSVAIPEFVAATVDVQGKLERIAKNASYNGWRLAEFKVHLEFSGAGGGPSGRYDKLTIYPIEVIKRGRSERQSSQARSGESRPSQTEDEPEEREEDDVDKSPCDLLASNIKETGSNYEGLSKTLEVVDGEQLIGCEM